jgi:hypothetical protein
VNALAAIFLLATTAVPVRAQWIRLDPDRCLGCRDNWEHFAGGAAVQLAAVAVFPKAPAWKRVLVVVAVGTAFELGQADTTRYHGRGYGFGLKDLGFTVAGGISVELVRALVRRPHHRR